MNKNKIPLLLKAANVDFVTEYKFHPFRKWRFDFAVIDKQIAIEYEGIMSAKARHTSVTGYTKDTEKYNAAALLGWKVLRYTALSSESQILDDLKQI
jgi:very-short-patch-repair endonuclease